MVLKVDYSELGFKAKTHWNDAETLANIANDISGAADAAENAGIDFHDDTVGSGATVDNSGKSILESNAVAAKNLFREITVILQEVIEIVGGGVEASKADFEETDSESGAATQGDVSKTEGVDTGQFPDSAGGGGGGGGGSAPAPAPGGGAPSGGGGAPSGGGGGGSAPAPAPSGGAPSGGGYAPAPAPGGGAPSGGGYSSTPTPTPPPAPSGGPAPISYERDVNGFGNGDAAGPAPVPGGGSSAPAPVPSPGGGGGVPSPISYERDVNSLGGGGADLGTGGEKDATGLGHGGADFGTGGEKDATGLGHGDGEKDATGLGHGGGEKDATGLGHGGGEKDASDLTPERDANGNFANHTETNSTPAPQVDDAVVPAPIDPAGAMHCECPPAPTAELGHTAQPVSPAPGVLSDGQSQVLGSDFVQDALAGSPNFVEQATNDSPGFVHDALTGSSGGIGRMDAPQSTLIRDALQFAPPMVQDAVIGSAPFIQEALVQFDVPSFTDMAGSFNTSEWASGMTGVTSGLAQTHFGVDMSQPIMGLQGMPTGNDLAGRFYDVVGDQLSLTALRLAGELDQIYAPGSDYLTSAFQAQTPATSLFKA